MKRSAAVASNHAAADGEAALYQHIRELVVAARQIVARGVDLVQVRTNFQIGRHIVEHEQQGERRAAYGKVVLKALAEKLTQEFGSGFSETSLKLMRQCYLLYANRISQTASDFSGSSAIGQTASDQLPVFAPSATPVGQRPFSLSWSHYVFLLGIKNPDERSFYEIEAASQDWTLREPKRQFDSGLYERLALNYPRHTFALSLSMGVTRRPFDKLRANGITFVGLPKFKTTFAKHL